MNIWRQMKLGDFISLEYGKPLEQIERDEAGAYAVFGANGEIARSNRFYVGQPSIIIGRKGSAGELKLSEDKFWPLDVTYFVTFDSAKYDLKFLYYLLQQQGLTKLAKGVKPGINRNDVYALEVSVPPLPEQRRIVALLDEAFAGLAVAAANAEKNLKNAREVFESYLNSVFTQKGEGWAENTLGDICKFHGGSQPPKSVFSYEPSPESVRLIQIRDYKSEKHIVYVPRALARRFCDESDVMIGRYGPPLFQILRGLLGAYNVALMKAAPNEKLVSKDFLYFFLRNRDILNYIINSSARAAGQIGLNKETIEPYPFAFPNLDEQSKLVASLRTVEQQSELLERSYTQKLAAIAELKQALLQKAFAGELTKDFSSNIVAFSPRKNVQITAHDIHAGILAFAFDRHRSGGKQNTFGRVKAQKFLHLVESVGKIDLGRTPMKDAAGPNDFPHLLRAEEWAKQNQFFEFMPRNSGNGYDFKPLAKFDAHLKKAKADLEVHIAQLNSALNIVLEMDSEEAELFATVHAAWNNLIIDKMPVTDSSIVRAARGDWHAEKLKIPEERFYHALNSIRTRKLQPDGTAKYVGGQSMLL